MNNISKDIIETFKSQMRGAVVLPADPGYDTARTIWNATIDRRPAVIARCAGVADVIASIGFARDTGLQISVRGGGHNIAGNAVCDDGIMIDLSGMTSVRIDPDARRACVEAGATLGDFDHEAQAFGLATPLGINSTTGVAGLTLGGGFGWLTRKYGLTVDNLVSAEVITAKGSRVKASADENADLFWAVRGGGGNFGIVTLFEFQLHPVGPELLSGLVVFPFSDARAVITRYRELTETASEDLCLWALLRKAPPLPFLPEEVHGQEAVCFPFLYAGDVEAGLRAIAPLRDVAKPWGEHMGPQPYAAWQSAFDALLTPGARNYWKSHNYKDLGDGVIDKAIEYAAKLPSPHCEIFFAHIGGRGSRVPADATAYSQRDANYVLNVHGRWETADMDEACISWARELFTAAAPTATGGVYINFLTQEETDRIEAAYGPNYQRLADIKKKYDPDNLFRMNHNIRPAD